MTNRLINETSPYLLQHADNPVDWYAWGPEALEKARAEDKPIFLSIGYAACHWCHVMAHESFEDEQTAALMNQHFVNIKVDREERPDLDGIYMQAIVTLTGSGGWPMSVFLTPEGVPLMGGTYFPPVRRYHMPSFRELLLAVAHAWENDRQHMLEGGQQLLEHMRAQTTTSGTDTPTVQAETLEHAATALAKAYDWANGGWGRAPKFPQPMAIEFLLRQATRGDRFGRDIAIHALKAMAKGGMYDVVGGGFARYSTDDQWHTPHFEKMLYDNAQLALAYLHGWLITGEAQFRRVCEETLDFVIREMMHPMGGFYSSLDADSEGEEGKFYVWSAEEVRAAFDDPQDVIFLTSAYTVSQAGNFEGKNILQRALDDAQLAEKFNLPMEEIPPRLGKLHQRLFALRSERVRPATDDKILLAWNALALSAFAEAGRYLGREDYLAVAQKNARFLLENMFQAGRLLRSWRDHPAGGHARAHHNAYLEDYAALIVGLLALYQSDANSEWYVAAINLSSEMLTHFADPQGGFFDTRDDHETLILRPKDIQDNATPCGNSLAALGLLQVAAYTGHDIYRQQAEKALQTALGLAERYPTAFANWLCAADFAIGPVQEVVIVSAQTASAASKLTAELWAAYRPRLISAHTFADSGENAPPLAAGRTAINGLPTAYVCANFVCQQPVQTPEQLARQLK